MMIPVEKEPDDLYENTRVYEVCIFCNAETVFWHKKTNSPICPLCAVDHKVSQIKDAKRISK